HRYDQAVRESSGLSKTSDDQRSIELITDRCSNRRPRGDSNDWAGGRERFPFFRERSHFYRPTTLALWLPDAGTGLERNGQDPVRQRPAGSRIVVRGDYVSGVRLGGEKQDQGHRSGQASRQ